MHGSYTSNADYLEIDGTKLVGYHGADENIVVVPEGVTEIGKFAFWHNSTVKYIQLPSTLKKIGDCAFRSCHKLKVAIIPDSVEELGKYAFCECGKLDSVQLGTGIKYIAESAFENCRNLCSIILHGGLEEIGYRAFFGCTFLTSLVLPHTLKKIGSLAFGGCALLPPNFHIPSSVKEISSRAFVDAPLSFLDFEAGSPYHVDGGCIILTDEKKLIEGDGYSHIPDDGSVTTIATCAFADFDGFQAEIVIPLTITTIEQYAFSNCSTLTIKCKADAKPKGWDEQWYSHSPGRANRYDYSYDDDEAYGDDDITVIWGCMSAEERKKYNPPAPDREEELQKIRLAELEKAGFNIQEGVLISYHGDSKKIVIPDEVYSIYAKAFTGNKTITSVNFNQAMEVRDYAFEDCTELTHVVFYDGLKFVFDHAFHNCTNLRYVNFPSSLTSIYQSAFAGTGLINVSAQADIIGNYAFSECANLKTFTLTNYDDDGVTLRWGAFKDCPRLESVSFDCICNHLEWDMFSGCTALKNISLPRNLRRIDMAVFKNCESLESIALPKSLDKIGENAFENCKSLTQISIPKDIKYIGDNAFIGCTGLTSVKIPPKFKDKIERIFGDIDASIIEYIS